MKISQTKSNLLPTNSLWLFFFGSILSSGGILLVTVGGSWDITNHLLNKPETFFSPPHALLYSGVAISLIGLFVSFFSWRRFHYKTKIFTSSLKFQTIGIALLVGAGPFDFIWHLNFGLDGLLSPPHLTLITGMIFCSLGGMLGIIRFTKCYLPGHKFSEFLHVLAILPLWLSCSGFVSSISLPFSNTDYFDFNPDPILALIIATLGYPFLISTILLSSSILSNYRFGVTTTLGGLFLLIYSSTSIIPNFALLNSIEFYSLNIIPFILADFIVSHYKTKKYNIMAGAILGSIFYMVYYPYVMYTFNEFLLGKLVSPSMIYSVYFEMIQDVFLLTILPALIMGIFGSYFAIRISQKISFNESKISL